MVYTYNLAIDEISLVTIKGKMYIAAKASVPDELP